MKCKLSEISNIQTTKGFPSLSSRLFVFICCIASEYLISENGLNKKDGKMFNTLRAYFISSDYSTTSYFKSLSENEELSRFLSYFPKNKKDFDQWENAKNIFWENDGEFNIFTLGKETIKVKQSFITLGKKDNKYYAYKAAYNKDGFECFKAIGENNITTEEGNHYDFPSLKLSDNDINSMTEADFFNSCEDLIKLSDEQRKAVTYNKNKNLVILAGAGSGKTRTLSSRFLYLHFVKHIKLDRLLLITFTRRARSDMQDKTIKLYKKVLNNPNAKTGLIKAKTIDSFYRYLITTYYADIGFSKCPTFKLDAKSSETYKHLIEKIIQKNRMTRSFFKDNKMNISRAFMHVLDTHMRGNVTLDSNYKSLARLVVDWQLEHNEIYTFASATAILASALSSNTELRKKVNSLYEYVLIDEFQDINDIQDSIFKHMYDDERVHFTFVGDDDQSIYFWRGSNNDIIKNIAKRDDTDQVLLNTNYRNNPYIVKAGNAILKKIDTRAKENNEIFSFQKAGSKIRVTNIKEDYSKLAQEIQSLIDVGTQPGKIAILSRLATSRLTDEKKPLDHVLDALESAGIAYDIKLPEVEFNTLYDLFKFFLLGLAKSEETYSFATQIIEDLRVEGAFRPELVEILSPSRLCEIIFDDGEINNKMFDKKAKDYLETLIKIKNTFANLDECEIEEIFNRYCLAASAELLHSNTNKALKYPIFTQLNTYVINNPLKWPTTKDRIASYFESFEDSLELTTDTNDLNMDDLTTVKVSTIHSFKGLEFEVVFLIGLNSDQFPNTQRLARERYRKEQDLKILIQTSKTLQEQTKPELVKLFTSLTSGGKEISCESQKFNNSYIQFIEYIKEEANLINNIDSNSLDNYCQAYSDFILPYINKTKEALANLRNEIDTLIHKHEVYIREQAMTNSAEALDKIKAIKDKEINESLAPLLNKLRTYDSLLRQIENSTIEARALNDLSEIAMGYLENIAKINELENYVKMLDEELIKKIEEERKLFYVAITRPSDVLYLVYSAIVDSEYVQSEFIKDIPNEYKMEYKIESIAERREAYKSIKKIEQIYDTSNGATIDDSKQIQESNKLFNNDLFREYLIKCENKFYNDNPLYNILTGAPRDYFVNALYHLFLQDYLGKDFTTEFLFNMQRSAEEFLKEMTGDDATFPVVNDKTKVNGYVDQICSVTKACITNPPTHDDTRKFLCIKHDDWKTKLKKCGIIHYFVRSGKFPEIKKQYAKGYKYPSMKNDADEFLKAIIDISNYRNTFAHNHAPVWNGDPKDDVLRFFATIIRNFYTEEEINNQVTIIANNKAKRKHIELGAKVYSKEYGVGFVKKIFRESPDYKYQIDFESQKTKILFDDSFEVIGNEGNAPESFEKSPKQIFKSSIGKIFSIEAVFPDDSVSLGTGFLIMNNYVLTNAHVITKLFSDGDAFCSDQITGCFYNQSYKIRLRVINYDINDDIAILELGEEYNFPGLHLTSVPLEIGDTVYAIGNTKGQGLCLLDGMVSDIDRKLGNNTYFMFNAGISNGNSGGPVLNSRGEVVGIASAGDKNVQNMNYAIPIKVINSFLERNKIK
ncbi:MAG: UvrD-helicase domain-containing protein [Bacilli bacterium]|nr:UvrD-helicase domain-containing protein [Bacilli bacterium]